MSLLFDLVVDSECYAPISNLASLLSVLLCLFERRGVWRQDYTHHGKSWPYCKSFKSNEKMGLERLLKGVLLSDARKGMHKSRRQLESTHFSHCGAKSISQGGDTPHDFESFASSCHFSRGNWMSKHTLPDNRRGDCIKP